MDSEQWIVGPSCGKRTVLELIAGSWPSARKTQAVHPVKTLGTLEKSRGKVERKSSVKKSVKVA